MLRRETTRLRHLPIPAADSFTWKREDDAYSQSAGHLVIVSDGKAVDVEKASSGRFSADPQAIYPRWAEFRHWADESRFTDAHPFEPADLGAPSPAPRQLFAIGLNYRAHARETGFAIPDDPPVFTKFVTSISGPVTEVALPDNSHTDWEVELVVIIGTHAYQASEAQAWSHVAGLAVGQDISERIAQMKGPSPQFSLAKSYPGFWIDMAHFGGSSGGKCKCK